MVYNNCKVYGPYTRNDNRQHVVLKFPDGKSKTVSYPKYIVECNIDQYLTSDDTIHHIDGDVHNNSISNLEIIGRSKHIRNDVKRLKEQELPCVFCGKKLTLKGKRLGDVIRRINKGKASPFCSKTCTGRYGSGVQYDPAKQIRSAPIRAIYTKKLEPL